jgi:tetratricopeptide (TPR) repeat protein
MLSVERRRGWSVIGAITLAIAVGLAGCMPTIHQQNRQATQQRWDEIRTRVKLQLATQQLHGGYVDDAVHTLREAIALDPRCPEPYVLLAQAHFEQDDLAAAREVLRQAARAAPEDPGVLYLRGVLAERGQDYDSAIDFYHRAGQLDPAQIDSVIAEAESLVAAGRSADALNLVLRRIDDFDGDAALATLQAEIALLTGDYETARVGFQTALRAGGEPDRSLIEEYGALLVRLERYREAVALLEPGYDEAQDAARPVVGETPEEAASPSFHRTLAAAYYGVGRHADAERILRRLLRGHPDTPQDWILLARVAFASQDWPTIRRCAKELQRLNPADLHASLLLAYLDWRQGHAAAATDAFRAAIEADPQDVLAHCLLGLALLKNADLEGARRHFLQALEIAPDCAWAQSQLERLDQMSAAVSSRHSSSTTEAGPDF